MEHLDERNPEPLGAVDQRLLAFDVAANIIGAEIGPMTEQFWASMTINAAAAWDISGPFAKGAPYCTVK